MSLPRTLLSSSLRSILCAALAVAVGGCNKRLQFHVSPEGSDAGDGSRAHPFATLERAREAVRAAKGRPATVFLAAGDYYFSKPFVLTAEDSGQAGDRTIWQAEPGAKPRLLGGRRLSATDFSPVTDPQTLARISQPATGNIVALDLNKLGVTHSRAFADVFNDAGGIAWLYCNGERMPLSRFPKDENYMRFKTVLYNAGGPTGDWRDPKSVQKVPPNSTGGIFEYREEFYGKHAVWAAQLDRGVWFKGYWRVAWENAAQRVLSIDTTNHTVTFAKPIPGGIGNKYTRPQGNGREVYWVMNLLEEIEQPGEWAMDFKDRKIYFYPPGDLARSELILLDREEPVISVQGASHIALIGLTIDAALGDGIRITGGEGNLVAGCTVRWVNKYAVVVDGGSRHVVQSNDLYHLGAGGIWLGGGNDTSSPRVAAGHRAVNNHIHDFGEIERVYAPGINCGFTGGGAGGHHTAVGMFVAHNLVHDTPHGGILYGSMDNVFEYNEIFRFCLVSNDLGGFYSYDYRTRNFGNITFRYNYIHSSAIGDGIYFDNDHPDMHVNGNIVWLKSRGKRGTAFLFKNGDMIKDGMTQPFDCVGNIAIECNTGYELVSLLPHLGKIESNVAVDCRKPFEWREIRGGKVVPTQSFETGPNLVISGDPGFENAKTGDLRLAKDSKIFRELPGFNAIPFEKIGLQIDEYRTTLPSEEEVDRACKHHPMGSGLGYDILDRPN